MGHYSNGLTSACNVCSTGYAAIPSLKMYMFEDDNFKNNIVQKCSGSVCEKVNMFFSFNSN